MLYVCPWARLKKSQKLMPVTHKKRIDNGCIPTRLAVVAGPVSQRNAGFLTLPCCVLVDLYGQLLGVWWEPNSGVYEGAG